MNWCQLFGCYFPADRRFSLGLPDHPSDCSFPFMVLSPLAFPRWRCARRCTRIVPCELAMALADRVLLASDVLARIALPLRGTFGASVLMRTLLWSVSAVLYPVFCSVTASGHLRRPAALGLLLRILRPFWVTVPPKTSLQGKERRTNFFRAPPRKQTFDLGSRAHSLSSARCDPINNGKIQQTETPSCTRTK
jgi:hypothetical protein